MRNANRVDPAEELARTLGDVVETFEKWDRLTHLGDASVEWAEFLVVLDRLNRQVEALDR